MDVPSGNSGKDYLVDFPGDIIRLHERLGFRYIARYSVWKEPLGVRNRTMAKNLAHKTIVDDSSKCTVASADYLLVFRKKGENEKPPSVDFQHMIPPIYISFALLELAHMAISYQACPPSPVPSLSYPK